MKNFKHFITFVILIFALPCFAAGPGGGSPSSKIDDILADTGEMQLSQPAYAYATLSPIMNGNNNIFIVTGGPVKIIEIIAIVETQIEGKGCLVNYNVDPTSPAGDTIFATTGTALEINGLLVGNLFRWDGVVANNLIANVNGVAIGMANGTGLIVPIGSIELAAVVATSATGKLGFYIRYIPLASGATISAAP